MEGHQQKPTFAVLPPQVGHPQQAPVPPQMQHPAQQTGTTSTAAHHVAPPTSYSSGNLTALPQAPTSHKYSSVAFNLARKAHLDNQMLVTKSTDIETEDGRISNREAGEKIKDAWMYKQIRARRDEFTHYRQVRAYIVAGWLTESTAR